MFGSEARKTLICHAPKIKELYTKEALQDFAARDSVHAAAAHHKSGGSVFLLIGPDKGTEGKRHLYDYNGHAIVAVHLNHVLYMYDPDWTPWNPPPVNVYKTCPSALPDSYTRRVTRPMHTERDQTPQPQAPSHLTLSRKQRSVYQYPGGYLLAKLREELCGATDHIHRPHMKVLGGGGENIGKTIA